jgi:hypothetical protein
MPKPSLVMIALLIAGCTAQPSRPNFVARSMQDCASGDRATCEMLGSLGSEAASAANTHVDQHARTQPQKDADAIMDGIRRARSSRLVQNLRIAPTLQDDL